ncbi:MAG: T9SS type A sorting domain-containing protein, partial [Bacteroidota bacterium]
YDFEDKNPKTGTQYYRIRQVDFDGTSSLSRAVEVYVPKQERVNLRQSTKQIKITSPSEIQQLEVWTIQGQMLSVIHPREKRYALSLRNLSKGVYIIHVQTSSQAVTHKIVIR